MQLRDATARAESAELAYEKAENAWKEEAEEFASKEKEYRKLINTSEFNSKINIEKVKKLQFMMKRI